MGWPRTGRPLERGGVTRDKRFLPSTRVGCSRTFDRDVRQPPAMAPTTRNGSPPEVTVNVDGPVTQRSVLDAVEASYPALRGTIRDHVTQKRRPFLRFFACEEDLSHESADTPLPDAVARGDEPLLIVGAIAGG